MGYIKQFLTKTRSSSNTSIFRYNPAIDAQNLEMYTLISITNGVGADSSRFNKFVWDGFIDGFLQQQGDIVTRLKNALIGAEFKLRELIRHDDLLEEQGVNLDLSAVVFKDSKAYIATLGDHKVVMYKRKVVDLSELLLTNKSNVGTILMSPEDMLLFFYSPQMLDKTMKTEEELDAYLTKVFDNEEATGGAFVAFSKNEGDEDEVSLVIEETPVIIEHVQEVENVSEADPVVKKKLDVNDVKTKSTNFVRKLGRILYQKAMSLRNSRQDAGLREMKVGGYKEKDLKTKRFVTLGIFLVLLLVLFFGIKSAFDARESRLVGEELNQTISKLDEEVTRANKAEVAEGAKLIDGVHEEFSNYLTELEDSGKQSSLYDEDLEKLADFEVRLAEVRDKIYKISPFESMELFFDTKLGIGEKSNPVGMTITKYSNIAAGEFIYVVDAGEKTIQEVSLETGNARKVEDPDQLIKKPMHVDIGNDGENEGLYVYDAESGMLVARKDSTGRFNNFKSLTGLSARALGEDKIASLAVFTGLDILNFLVPTENRIIRAQSFGLDSYGLPTEFISYPGFDKAFDFFGDQYIYVLSRGINGIKRFTPATGLSNQIALVGLYDDLDIVVGYTGPTMDRAFVVFDVNSNRFIYFEKPIEIGELKHPNELWLLRQFEYRGERDDVFKDLRGIVIEHSDTSMFVLDGVRIWKINIQLD